MRLKILQTCFLVTLSMPGNTHKNIVLSTYKLIFVYMQKINLICHFFLRYCSLKTPAVFFGQEHFDP